MYLTEKFAEGRGRLATVGTRGREVAVPEHPARADRADAAARRAPGELPAAAEGLVPRVRDAQLRERRRRLLLQVQAHNSSYL